MLCKICGHEVVRLRFIYRPSDKGGIIEGCYFCTDEYAHSVYPTERRTVCCKDGTSFDISPAHWRDISMRKVGPDLKHVYRDTGRTYMFLGDKK